MKTAWRILHLEDDPLDAELVARSLHQDGFQCEWVSATNQEDFIAALSGAPLDAILSDSAVGGMDAESALHLARSKNIQAPFIFVSNFMTPELRQKHMCAGASECVAKSEIAKLPALLRKCVHSRPQTAAPSEWYCRAMEDLVGIIQDLSLARDLPRIMEIVRTAARRLTGAPGATFVLRDHDRCHYADEDAIEPLWKGRRFLMSECISGWVMLNRQSAIIEDIYQDDRIPKDAYRPTFVKSLVMVPIRTRDPVGAIGTYWSQSRVPRDEEVRVLQALADSTSVAMENVQLYAGLEQKVMDRTARLEAANQELESFSYSISHDLRAPLRHIHGYIQMMQDDSETVLSSEGRRFAGIAMNSAQRLGELIDDLLEFSRMGRAEMIQSNVDFHPLVSEVLQELTQDLDSARMEWTIDKLPVVQGDPSLLKQVWINLLSNAIKYSSKKPKAEIQIRASSTPNAWHFSVKDNGLGFDDAYAGSLFGVFKRLHTQEEMQGTGIGLANVRRIIARHGGNTWAEGQLGEGATFYFSLPRIPVGDVANA